MLKDLQFAMHTASAVLALEASRLARNDRDWSQLVELGAISNVVLIDHDGIYDPRLVNDRLLLGLNGRGGERYGKGVTRSRHVGSRETNASEPPGRPRNAHR
jgi:hypothetical protein